MNFVMNGKGIIHLKKLFGCPVSGQANDQTCPVSGQVTLVFGFHLS